MIAPKVDILIVDDREDGLIALDAVLNDPRYNLIRASSGAEAVRLVAEHDVAVILMDVQMPHMDGFQAATLIKKMAGHKHTPIIFVTAINKDDDYIYKGYTHGAVDYVFKPFDAHILRSKVAVFVELYNKSKQLEEQADLIRQSERRERYLRLAELEVESLKRYRGLADSIPHAVWRSKPDGTMDYFNQVWCDFTGLSADQSMGAGWQAAVHPDDLRALLKEWMGAIYVADEFQVECQIKSKTGEWIWHWIRAVAERNHANEIIAWLGTCTDIHQRKSNAEKLIEARKEADLASQAKTNFLANMSHEIRTPLNSVLGFAELMAQSDLSPEHKSNLATIKRNGEQLLKIIDEILDISKVEANKLEIELIEVDLRRELSEIQALLEVQAQAKGLTFSIQCTNLIPAKIQTDPTRLRQILTNMIGNAIKFTAKGSITLNVNWSPDGLSHSGTLKILISDTGVGIGSENIEKLFKPFMQADSSTTRKFGGTGLGLALSRRLAVALGGDIRLLKTEKDSGTVFSVEIHTEVSSGSSLFKYSDHHIEIEDVIESTPEPDCLKDLKVLVVDDASDNRTLMTRFLSGAGAQVDVAADGFEGVRKALENTYDVVLMDIQMPQLDGYAATAKLRAQGYTRPIIALTAHALKQEREHSMKAGCNDHLTKPIDRRTLISQVGKYSGRKTTKPSDITPRH